MAVSGENLVPSGGGRAGSGAAYVLGNTTPDALAIIQQGERARALARERQRQAQLKADQENAKQYNDFVKFEQDGSPYFGEALQGKVYQPLMGNLTTAFKDNRNDLFARNTAAANYLQPAKNETVQSKAKTQFINDKMKGFQADPKLFDAEYAGKSLSAALRGEDGTGKLPSQFDEEGHFNGLLGDEKLYKEPEVVRRATEKLAPIISQRVAEAGTIGGQHTADQVRGRFVVFQNGRPVLNADGTPKLNLTADTQALLESDPLFKLKVDAREAAYNKQREADPNIPQMSRRGHIAQMVGPLAFYDARHDEGLNRLPPQPKSGSGPKQVEAFDERNVTSSEVGAVVKGAPSDFEQALGLSQFTPKQYGFHTSRKAGAPTIPQTNGTRKPVELRITPKRMATEDANGNLVYRDNNTTPIEGIAGEPLQLPVNPKTNQPVYPKSKDEEAELYRKGYKPSTFVAVAADKNEKFFADRDKYIKQELEANKTRFDGKKTYAQIEAEAASKVSKGTGRVLIPYDADNAASINNQAGAYYRDFHRGTMKYGQQQAAAPAAKPLYTPKGKAPTAPTTNQKAADPTGGLYNKKRP